MFHIKMAFSEFLKILYISFTLTACLVVAIFGIILMLYGITQFYDVGILMAISYTFLGMVCIVAVAKVLEKLAVG